MVRGFTIEVKGQRLKEQGQRILVTVSWLECNETQQGNTAQW